MMVGASLFGLFVAAFLAATPIPFQSEVVFLALLANKSAGVLVLILIASVGNVLGSCVTYAVGRGIGGQRSARWFPVRPEQLARAEVWFQKWGLWALLLSWAPGGDLIVALSGVMRVSIWRFLALVSLAKTLRYGVVALIGLGIWG
ncbi:MAG: DedA family protein [Rhodobacteraceae bacterium]|nr:DedA family protein [Paracoccaceae bacterium]MCF8515129.1 DedA family protein [Paracoccaceae bacterium]MCF8519373.1 DedA family protein [Paracoccaceae bacterium]